MREDDLPSGYRLIKSGQLEAVAKEEYVPLFSDFQLPRIRKSGGGRSGRADLIPIALAPDSSNTGLIRRSLRGGVFGRLLKELYLDVGRPRPLRELQIATYARSVGVQTPEIAAALVERANRLFYRGALVTKEISPSRDLQEEALAFLPRDRQAIREKRQCIRSAGRLVARMHDAGIQHADLHLKNILKSGDMLYLLDFDAARFRNPLPERAKRMNLLRLYRSVQKINRNRPVITRTDVIRFMRSYAGETGHSKEALLKGLRRMLPAWRLKWRLSDMLKV